MFYLAALTNGDTARATLFTNYTAPIISEIVYRLGVMFVLCVHSGAAPRYQGEAILSSLSVVL